MRSALLTSCCAAALCVAATHRDALAQAAPDFSLAPLTVTVAQPATLLAESSAASPFSGSSSSLGENAFASGLPEEPQPVPADAGAGQAGLPQTPVSHQPIASKYTAVILAGQGAVPLTAGDKVMFGLRQQVSPFTMLSRVLSATWSQAVDSQPHYGQGWEPYGQRVGAAFARGAVQDLATMAVFDPIFRDDPRYYVLGRQHKLINRAIYAATRVVITRTDSGHNTVNAPLLLGYAAAAGANMAYYPQRDRNFSDAATGYAGSLGGSVLGMEVNEFIGDALRLVHLRHD